MANYPLQVTKVTWRCIKTYTPGKKPFKVFCRLKKANFDPIFSPSISGVKFRAVLVNDRPHFDSLKWPHPWPSRTRIYPGRLRFPRPAKIGQETPEGKLPRVSSSGRSLFPEFPPDQCPPKTARPWGTNFEPAIPGSNESRPAPAPWDDGPKMVWSAVRKWCLSDVQARHTRHCANAYIAAAVHVRAQLASPAGRPKVSHFCEKVKFTFSKVKNFTFSRAREKSLKIAFQRLNRARKITKIAILQNCKMSFAYFWPKWAKSRRRKSLFPARSDCFINNGPWFLWKPKFSKYCQSLSPAFCPRKSLKKAKNPILCTILGKKVPFS